MNEADAAHKSYVLNKERDQLNEIEISQHMEKMLGFGFTYQEMGIMGYGSKASVSRQVNLLKSPKKVQSYIVSGKLTKAHGIELNKLNDEKQILKIAKLAVDNGWSAKKIKTTIERLKRKSQRMHKQDSGAATVSACSIPGVHFKDAKDMSELSDESVGLVLTSPPYCAGSEYEKGYSYDEHLENIKDVLKESARVLVPGGIAAINVGNITNFKGKRGSREITMIKPMLHVYDACLRKLGFHLQDEIIWVKDFSCFTQDESVNYTDKTPHAGYRIVNRHEPIYIFKKNGERPVPEDENIILESRLSRKDWENYAPSVWRISPAPRGQGHPNVFPEELVRRIIKMYSYKGETVLDPFLGSGTTIKVARELGREGIGYEREEELYRSVIEEKLRGTFSEENAESSETVSGFVKGQMEELEANQPAGKKMEVAMSEGMEDDVAGIIENNEKELAYA